MAELPARSLPGIRGFRIRRPWGTARIPAANELKAPRLHDLWVGLLEIRFQVPSAINPSSFHRWMYFWTQGVGAIHRPAASVSGITQWILFAEVFNNKKRRVISSLALDLTGIRCPIWETRFRKRSRERSERRGSSSTRVGNCPDERPRMTKASAVSPRARIRGRTSTPGSFRSSE